MAITIHPNFVVSGSSTGSATLSPKGKSSAYCGPFGNITFIPGSPSIANPFQYQGISSFPQTAQSTEPKPDAEVAKLKERVAELESDNRAAVRELASVNEALIKLRNEMEEIKAYLSQGPDTQRSNQKTDYWR